MLLNTVVGDDMTSPDISGSSPTPSSTDSLDKPGKKLNVITHYRNPRTLAPNLTRRSHKKSRSGCFNCKSRKIKCGEQRPCCGNCLLKEIDCQYPNSPGPPARQAIVVAKKPPSPHHLSAATDTFTLGDMRLFHHFLTTAYPHLPVGNDQVWVHEVPKFAQEHPYLMHAILALGGSHLDRLTKSNDHTTQAMSYRVKAISGLNEALAKSEKPYGAGDAMLATCYALTFQSSHMDDGLQDFITMVRGCALLTGRIREENAKTAFNLQPDWHFKIMAPKLSGFPEVDPNILESGLRSVQKLLPFINSEAEELFYKAVCEVLIGLGYSSRNGYIKFIGMYGIWYELCHDSFQTFMDINNSTAQILLAYFIAVQLIMIPLSEQEWSHRSDGGKPESLMGILGWADRISKNIPENMKKYLDWPNRITSIAKAEIAHIEMEPRVLRKQRRVYEGQECEEETSYPDV